MTHLKLTFIAEVRLILCFINTDQLVQHCLLGGKKKSVYYWTLLETSPAEKACVDLFWTLFCNLVHLPPQHHITLMTIVPPPISFSSPTLPCLFTHLWKWTANALLIPAGVLTGFVLRVRPIWRTGILSFESPIHLPSSPPTSLSDVLYF